MYRIFLKKKLFSKNMEKKFQLALLNPLGRSTGNKTLFKGGLTRTCVRCYHVTEPVTSPLFAATCPHYSFIATIDTPAGSIVCT